MVADWISAVLPANYIGEGHTVTGIGDLDGHLSVENGGRDKHDLARINPGNGIALIAQILDFDLDNLTVFDWWFVGPGHLRRAIS